MSDNLEIDSPYEIEKDLEDNTQEDDKTDEEMPLDPSEINRKIPPIRVPSLVWQHFEKSLMIMVFI